MFSSLRQWFSPAQQTKAVALAPELAAYDQLVAGRTSMLSLISNDVQQFVLRPLVCPPYVLATRANGDVHALHTDGRPSSTEPIWRARTQSLAVARDDETVDHFGVVGLGRWLMSSVVHKRGGAWCAYDARTGVVREVKRFNSRRNWMPHRDTYPWFSMVNDAGTQYGMAICGIDREFFAVQLSLDLSYTRYLVKLYNDDELEHRQRDLVVDDQQHRCYTVVESWRSSEAPDSQRQVCAFDIYRGSLDPTQVEKRKLWRYDGAVKLQNTIGLAESFHPGEHFYNEFDLRTPNPGAVLTVRLDDLVTSPFSFENRLITSDRQENVYYKSPMHNTLHSVDRRATACWQISPPTSDYDFKLPQKLTYHS